MVRAIRWRLLYLESVQVVLLIQAESQRCLAIAFAQVFLCVRVAGDIRLEVRGTDMLITGKQGMTGGYKQAQVLPIMCLIYVASSAVDAAGSKMSSVSLSPAGTFRAHCKLPQEVDTSSLRAELLNGLLCIKARKQFRG